MFDLNDRASDPPLIVTTKTANKVQFIGAATLTKFIIAYY
jgi:hypothetical protein